MGKQAVDLYQRTPQEYRDERTHVCVLNACSHSGLIDDARQIFHSISHPAQQIYTTMVNERVLFMFYSMSLSIG